LNKNEAPRQVATPASHVTVSAMHRPIAVELDQY